MNKKPWKLPNKPSKNAQNEKDRDYEGKISKFYEDVQTRPYLLRESNTLRLLSQEEADAALEKYGISGKEALQESQVPSVSSATNVHMEGGVDVRRDINIGEHAGVVNNYFEREPEQQVGIFLYGPAKNNKFIGNIIGSGSM